MKEKRKHQPAPKILYPLLWQDWSLQAKQPNSKDTRDALIFGCCATIFFTVAFVLSAINYMSPIVKDGILTEAVVIDIEQTSQSSKCNHYEVTYSFDIFSDDGKQSYQGMEEISDCSVLIQLNEVVKITYVASDPSNSMIGESINKITDAPFVLGGFGLFLLGSLYLLFGGIYFVFHGYLAEEKLKNDL